MSANKNTVLLGMVAVFVALLLLTMSSVDAAPLENTPVTITQPDGTVLRLLASGDEYYNWVHDADGYTILQDPITGYYVYARLVNGELVSTRLVAGASSPESAGLRPHLNISPERMGSIRQSSLDHTARVRGEAIHSAPKTGTINNLVIFIRFAGESEFSAAMSTYTDMLNSSTVGANSLLNYYQEVSYNTLTVSSGLYPTPGAAIVSYQDGHPRGYYQPYNAATNSGGYTGGDLGSERTIREHTLLRDAIAYINGLGQFPGGASIDGDDDGVVDCLTFVVSGQPTGWASLLWPHQWSLFTYTVTINGRTVDNYSFHLNSSLDTGVLAHEMFHVLGAPDLYHYSYDGFHPVGSWDVMENDQNPPQHMGAFMKFKYGTWINSIPTISSPGTYVLNPLTSPTNNCYRIESPHSATEYFVVEYRRETGTFEPSLPGTGLLVYRINTLADGNAQGPPDEVYLYRPGGTPSSDGSVSAAQFSSNVGRIAINDGTDPSSFLSNGGLGGLSICNVGASDATLSFDICTQPGFSISGNAGTVNTTLSYVDGTRKVANADESGQYFFSVPSGWAGTVTPSKTGYTFTPASRSYADVQANQTAQDYSAVGPTNLLQDPSFESLISPNPYWAEFSTNYGTPLCTVGVCGDGGGTAGPRTGTTWSWFGGATSDETGWLSQTVTIPPGSADLEFYLWIGMAGPGSDAADVFTAEIDDVPVFSANATQTGEFPGYTRVSVDVSEYADGGSHTVKFLSVTTEQTVNFNLDDVALTSVPSGTTGSCCEASAGVCTMTTQAACIGTWTEAGLCTPNLCDCTRSFALRFPRWEWVTVGVRPSNRLSSAVFASLGSNLAIAKDDAGRVYIPGVVDNLSPVNFLDAFQVMLRTRADTLRIDGTLPVVAEDCVPIAPGRWNLIPYLTDQCALTCADDVTVAMASIADCVTIVKDDDGLVWIPSVPLNTIGQMKPGKGYYVFPNASCTQAQSLCYPACTSGSGKELAAVAEPAAAVHFAVAPTGLSDVVVVMGMEGTGCKAGDDVALFSGGRAVGSAVYAGTTPFVIPVWQGDEERGLHGFVPGGVMQARIWSRGSGSETDVPVQTENGSPATFVFDPYIRVTLGRVTQPAATTLGSGIVEVRPNPMREQVEIRYRTAGMSDVRIGIYDVAGRVVKELSAGTPAAGSYAVLWDGRDVSGRRAASGTYFVRMTSATGPQQRRLLVIW